MCRNLDWLAIIIRRQPLAVALDGQVDGCLMEDAGGTVKTVEGNYWNPANKTNQSVLEKSDRKVSEIVGYYNLLAPAEL